MAEQFGFERGFRQRRAIEPDERTVLARRKIMGGACEELLAGAGFASQQQGRMCSRHDIDLAEDGADRLAGPDDADQRMFLIPGGRTRRVFLEAPLLLHQPFAVARDHVVKMQGLADHRGDHREVSRVLLDHAHRRRGPRRDRPPGCPMTSPRCWIGAPMTASASSAGQSAKCGSRVTSVDDRRRLRRDDAVDEMARQALEMRFRVAFAPAVSDSAPARRRRRRKAPAGRAACRKSRQAHRGPATAPIPVGPVRRESWRSRKCRAAQLPPPGRRRKASALQTGLQGFGSRLHRSERLDRMRISVASRFPSLKTLQTTFSESSETKLLFTGSSFGATASLCTLNRRSWIGEDATKSW